MVSRSFRSIALCGLAATGSVLALVACGRSPAAPGGKLQVHVSQNNDGPSPGKTVEVLGRSLTQTTDANGMALFFLKPGSYVVRAYELGGPGPGLPYVDQSVEIQPARTSRAEFNDCTMCVAPER